MRQDRFEDMIFAATSLPQETSTLENFLRWFSPAIATVFLLVALINVEPHATSDLSIIAMNSKSSTEMDQDFSVEVQSFDTADDYLLLTSLEF